MPTPEISVTAALAASIERYYKQNAVEKYLPLTEPIKLKTPLSLTLAKDETKLNYSIYMDGHHHHIGKGQKLADLKKTIQTHLSKDKNNVSTLYISDQDNKGVLSLNVDKGGLITEVRTYRDLPYTAYLLEQQMPKADFTALKTALAKTPLDLTLTKEQRQSVIHDIEAYKDKAKKRETRLKQIKEEYGSPNGRVSPDPDTARLLEQGEYALVSADDKQHILGTRGATQCLCVACYNETTKTAALAHVYYQNSLEGVAKMMQEIKKGKKPGSTIKVYLAGGANEEASEKQVADIIAILDSDKEFELVKAKIINGITSPQSLAIDAKTGKVSQAISPEDFDKGKNVRERNDRPRGGRTPLIRAAEDLFLHPAKRTEKPKEEPKGSTDKYPIAYDNITTTAAVPPRTPAELMPVITKAIG